MSDNSTDSDSTIPLIIRAGSMVDILLRSALTRASPPLRRQGSSSHDQAPLVTGPEPAQQELPCSNDPACPALEAT